MAVWSSGRNPDADVGLTNGRAALLHFAADHPDRVRALAAADAYAYADLLMQAKLGSWVAAMAAGGAPLRFDVATPWVWGARFLDEDRAALLEFRDKGTGMPVAAAVSLIEGAMRGQVAIKRDPQLFERALRALAPGAAADDRWRRLVAEGHEQRLQAALLNLGALTRWHPGDALRRVAAPILVVAGALDPLTGGANVRRASDVLGARSVVLPGVGHSPNVEAPDALAALLVELWRSVRHH